MLLLNPGPVTLSERVRGSLLQVDLCHRESEFFDLQHEVGRRLLAIHDLDPQQWAAVLMTASGTGAVESMIAALVPPSGRLLTVENGVYGERMAQIAAQYGIAHERWVGDWMQELDLSGIARRLDTARGAASITHLAVVHHETTTGRLNDLQALGELCRARGVSLLVDAVSSFGAEAIDFQDSSLAAIAATANKCLHGVPGAAFVIVRRSALATAACRTYYLDLSRLARLQDQRGTPFTPAVHVYYALLEALREYADEGGRAVRHQRYARLAEQVRVGLAALGMDMVIAPEHSSVVLHAYRLPAGVNYSVLHDALKADGFVIYAGQADLAKTLFRISTMGHVTSMDMQRLLMSFARLLG
ncbi:MAG: 2-aminoethylphosphonate aminotransferase [Pseudomonadota bacterium]|nr:2-aminoethylphosphonate aminotransferase [Pseudomonadota bacterium]